MAISALSGCEQVPNRTGTMPAEQSTGANAATSMATGDGSGSQAAPPDATQTTGATVYAYKLASGQGKADANGLAPVAVKMTPGSVDAARVALESLTEGADSPLPPGTKILSVVIDSDSKIASVNFSSDLKRNFHGGETGEAQVIDSVLKTLGQFDTIQKVQFLMDGKPLDTLGGAQDLSQPLPTPQSPEAGGSGAEFGGNGAKQ